jgi:DnaJ-class molecular chaperone
MTIAASGLDLYGILQVDPRAEPGVIQAAYRTLALRMHPDHSRNENSAGAMAILNRAYSVLRDPSQRSAYDQTRSSVAAIPVADARSSSVSERLRPRTDDRSTDSMTVSFGRYQGWTLQQISQQDPEYLEWLRRHSSGIGYRRQIDVILDAKRTAAAIATPYRRRR